MVERRNFLKAGAIGGAATATDGIARQAPGRGGAGPHRPAREG
ncbi:twin-arginine translocation signal domain-containing protein [Streptomyces sp. NPDC058412]